MSLGSLVNIILMISLKLISVFLPDYETFYYQGDSMDKNSNYFGLSNNYQGQELSEGDVITYSSHSMNIDYVYDNVGHRIIKKYDSYNPETACYYTIQKDDEWLFVTPNRVYECSEKPKNNSEDLRGSTVYILKGDNNEYADPFLITEDEISHIHTNIKFPIQ